MDIITYLGHLDSLANVDPALQAQIIGNCCLLGAVMASWLGFPIVEHLLSSYRRCAISEPVNSAAVDMLLAKATIATNKQAT